MIDASLNDADNKTETATEKGGKRDNETTRKYLRYLKLERNYTANTVEAYRNDLAHLERYMKREGLTPETASTPTCTTASSRGKPAHCCTEPEEAICRFAFSLQKRRLCSMIDKS